MWQKKDLFSDEHNLGLLGAVADDLMSTLATYDPYTCEHSNHVRDLSVALGRRLGLSRREIKMLEFGGRLHDIGKLYIPKPILNKPGGLTDNEFKLMKAHTLEGHRVVFNIETTKELANLVRSHHEKWNGGGYPDGLSGHDIDLLARVISVVDVYDALTTDRPYRDAMPHAKAISIIENDSGTAFDPEISDAFIRNFRDDPPPRRDD